ncbi:SCO6745 family protein [Embleya sp. NPDC001921]
MDARTGRRCHNVLNPLHSLVYFAPEADLEFVAVGLRKGRMGYFASRAAPMGAVGAATVRATFYNFSPALIGRHIPAAWASATPEAVYAARLRVVDQALRRVLGEDLVRSAELREAAELALSCAWAGGPEARPLYAAHAELDPPDPAEQPHVALWHAVTLIREYRGDGHLVALVEAELDGIEALFTHTATGRGFVPEFAIGNRGWTVEQWEAARDRLATRGLVDTAGALTDAGRELRRSVEERTDRLGLAPFHHLGDTDTARLTDLAAMLTGTALANGAFPPGVFATPKG